MLSPKPPTDAVLTIPNLLTFARLAMVPLFLWGALGLENMALAFSFAFAGLVTDLLDGRIARRYGQVSQLGIRLDPLSDRLALAAGAIVIMVHELAPLWAALAVLTRDVMLVVIGVPILKARGLPIPAVSQLGKYGAFAVSVAFGLFLASAIPGIDTPNEVVRALAWIAIAIGLPLYYAAGYEYLRAGLRTLSGKEGTNAPG